MAGPLSPFPFEFPLGPFWPPHLLVLFLHTLLFLSSVRICVGGLLTVSAVIAKRAERFPDPFVND